MDAVSFNKKHAYIYALSDGFVSKKIANEGEVLNAGMPVLAINEKSNAAGWNLKLGVTDKDWAAIDIGQTATVHIDAFPTSTFTGRVVRKSQAADQADGSFQVELLLSAGNDRLAVGMFAKATLASPTAQQLPVIPYTALVEADGDNAFVFVPLNDHTVKRVPVTIAGFDNTEVTVRSGLENVSAIVVSNSAFLNEHSTIRIVR